ncbi:MAG: MucR family transcriptional regulator [Cypionkella sp.]
MTDNTTPHNHDLVEFTGEIIAAYVSHNAINIADLPGLIAKVHAALATLGAEGAAAPASAPDLKPAVSIRKSVTPEYLICLEDGKQFKSLKRHLMTHFQLTPEQYRAKWGLPDNYPMVAPAYSATRSTLAKSAGLGRKPAAAEAAKPKRAPAKSPA